jgi:DNA-binding transcriptional regulator YhcF (GntR family)
MKLYEFFNVPVEQHEKENKSFHKAKSQEEKQKMADEVFWFILDHDALHKEHVIPSVRELAGQTMNPDFNRSKFAKQWIPMVSKGCTMFHKKNKMTQDPRDVFDDEFKDSLCKRFAEKFIKEINDKEYYIGAHSK